jgi:hypothetical protein
MRLLAFLDGGDEAQLLQGFYAVVQPDLFDDLADDLATSADSRERKERRRTVTVGRPIQCA